MKILMVKIKKSNDGVHLEEKEIYSSWRPSGKALECYKAALRRAKEGGTSIVNSSRKVLLAKIT